MKRAVEMTTPELLNEAADVVAAAQGYGGVGSMADELRIRSARLTELEYQAAPDRNDLTGMAPLQILQTVNAPSPKGS